MVRIARKLHLASVFCLVLSGMSAATGRCETSKFTGEISFETRLAELEREVAAMNSVSNAGTAVTGGDGESCDHDGCCRSEGWTAGAELTYMQAQSSFFMVALAPGGVFFPNPMVAVFDFEVAPRFWVGYDTAEDLEWRFTYWTFDTTTNVNNGAQLDEAISADTLDFEHRYSETLFNCEVQFTVGARYANYHDSANLIFGVLSQREFEGGGGTLGLWFERPFGSYGITVVGGVRGSFMYGRNSFVHRTPGAATPPPQSSDKSAHIWDAQIGFQWERIREDNSRLFARLGFEMQDWNLQPINPAVIDADAGFVGVAFALGLDR